MVSVGSGSANMITTKQLSPVALLHYIASISKLHFVSEGISQQALSGSVTGFFDNVFFHESTPIGPLADGQKRFC